MPAKMLLAGTCHHFSEGCRNLPREDANGWTRGCSRLRRAQQSSWHPNVQSGRINIYWILKVDSGGIFLFLVGTSGTAGKLSLLLPPRHSLPILSALQTALIVDVCGKKELLSFPPSLDQTNPLTCCRKSKEGSPKSPFPPRCRGWAAVPCRAPARTELR